MKKLKCSSCGGTLAVEDVPGQGLFGRCIQCDARYAVQLINRQHVVVEHRMPAGMAPTPTASADQQRRMLLIGGGVAGVAALLGIGSLLVDTGASDSLAPTQQAEILWNIGGKGVEPGMFRDYPQEIITDGTGRVIVHSSSGTQPQVYGPDGAFLRVWPVMSPYFDLLTSLGRDRAVRKGDGRNIVIVDALTGAEITSTPIPDLGIDTRDPKDGAPMPDGGFALLFDGGEMDVLHNHRQHSGDASAAKVYNDRIALFSADGTQQRIIGPLLGKVVAEDANIRARPDIAAFDTDAAGRFYFLLASTEDFETRQGIYVFNPDGSLLRHIATGARGYGDMAVTPDGTIYTVDPWSSDLVQYKGDAVTRVSLPALATTRAPEIGNASNIALQPNGDIVIATMSHRLIAIRWK